MHEPPSAANRLASSITANNNITYCKTESEGSVPGVTEQNTGASAKKEEVSWNCARIGQGRSHRASMLRAPLATHCQSTVHRFQCWPALRVSHRRPAESCCLSIGRRNFCGVQHLRLSLDCPIFSASHPLKDSHPQANRRCCPNSESNRPAGAAGATGLFAKLAMETTSCIRHGPMACAFTSPRTVCTCPTLADTMLRTWPDAGIDQRTDR